MSLEHAEVADYLLARGLVKSKAIVEGEFVIEDVSRLHRVFLVTVRPGRSYALKVGAPVREAANLERLHASGALGDRLPGLVEFDTERGVLILEAAPGAADLGRCRPYSLTLARAAGRALAALHNLPAELFGERETDPARRLLVHRVGLADLAQLSAASRVLVAHVQEDAALGAELEQLVSEAVAESPVHGDIRWENCLGVADARGRRARLQLIDWESAAGGDPALDVGAFVGEYVRAWLGDLSLLTDAAREHSEAERRRMSAAASAFVAAYGRTRALPPVPFGRLVRRALRHAGARLILAALEDAQGHSEPTAAQRETVRLGAEFLHRPDELGVRLLRLRPTWA